ncbi:MAG: acyl-ACP--UDP-N-acetylglucosamine O-acyltransferase [Candidatus Obscuribacterales bacterium]|nr:acyl-ACP--UDP-N-acetylglucosamine O-acyltransferase [Candidatus Obscuribacterales bacterium]
MPIHSTAIIADGAKIDPAAEIGPYVVIGPDVQIGPGTVVGAHAIIDGVTTIGADCKIYAGASIGLDPQDLGYKGEATGVIIGNRVTIREYVTIHRATKSGFTTIGDDCFLMNYSHVAHNCVVGNSVIMANNCTLAGYVTVGDAVVMGGDTVVHQNCRVGRMAMMGGCSATRQDLPPFGMCDGRPAKVRGTNSVGLKRNKLSLETRMAVKKAFRIIYVSEVILEKALERVEKELGHVPEVIELLDFFKTSKRGVVSPSGGDSEDKTDFGEDKDDANLVATSSNVPQS